MVLPSRREIADGSVHPTSRGDERRTDGHGDTAPAVSPVRASAVRLRQLRGDRGQNVGGETRHLRDIGADSQARGPGAGIGDPSGRPRDTGTRARTDVSSDTDRVETLSEEPGTVSSQPS